MWTTLLSVCLVWLLVSESWAFLNVPFTNAMNHYLNEIRNFKSGVYGTIGEKQPATSGFSYATNEFGLNPSLTDYDFIIVGSGPAGCVIANRLSERKHWKILLLEAGKRETLIGAVPLLAAYFQSTDFSWGYKAERQEGACLGMVDQECGLPRGKALGGTSVINYMIYNRGNVRDFDRWSEAGNTGWSYNEVLPYFKKSERANLRGKEDSPYHGHSGPLSVEDVPYRSQLVHAFVTGSKQAGHQEIDYNGANQIGVSYVQANTLRGTRYSASRAYIVPIQDHRPNLHVLTSARVTQILIDPHTKAAYGVEYVKNKRTYRAHARMEVIISAGTFNSPQLLMLSGIGDRAQLQRIGVPLVHELPGVGRNMFDHMSHFGPTFIVNTTGASLNVDQIGVPQAKELLVHGNGILTTIGGVEALNFIKTKNSKEPADLPDAELIFVPGSLASDQGTGLKSGMRVTQSLYDRVYKPLENGIDHWSIMVMLFHPKSSGYLELKDKNPFHWPRFYPNYFQYDEDVETLLQGIKESIRIAATPAMQRLGARIHDISLPNCEHLRFGSDDYWRCSIRTMSCTLHHQVGTCKMGPATDASAVVDPQLRVHGVQRLRVADCSIIPVPPTSHTNAMSFMIGEKVADMIKTYWDGRGAQ